MQTNALMTTTIETINFELCKDKYSTINFIITQNMLCAGKIDGGKGIYMIYFSKFVVKTNKPNKKFKLIFFRCLSRRLRYL